MNNKLIHRGPDAQHAEFFDNVAFGFARLSIIGLSNGMQPIYNERKNLMLICNGEIFNYIELKKSLVAKGHSFSTESDVEVILHLYEDKGIDFLNDLNGQFAFALYDKEKKQLLCARDQMGIIPFFYTSVYGTFIFGSEIKAILEHPLVSASIDVVGLDQVLTFPGLISPRTMFANINSLENGHLLIVNDEGEIKDREYWDLPTPIYKERSEVSYLEELAYHFENAVRLRLRSDVPSGYYLSGGLDSSLIAMTVYQLTNQKKRAFSIDFPDANITETHYQRIVAAACHADLYQKTFFYDDISEHLQRAIYHCECPIKETYNTASLHLSKTVRQNDIKVILSGEGADEFFAGYVGYRFDKIRAENLLGEHPATEEEISLRKKVWGDGNFLYEGNFTESQALRQSIYAERLRKSFDEINCLNHHVIHEAKIRGRDTLHKRSYLDYKLRLVDHLVSDHGDRMAMANSVEVRYPFLDKNLVEFSTRIPADLKLNDFTEKYLLRKLGETRVPQEVLNREKFGFVAPGSPYLLQRDNEYINDILSYERIKRQGYFDADCIEKLKKQYCQPGFTINVPFETDLLIVVITFGILLDQFIETGRSQHQAVAYSH